MKEMDPVYIPESHIQKTCLTAALSSGFIYNSTHARGAGADLEIFIRVAMGWQKEVVGWPPGGQSNPEWGGTVLPTVND